jgi:glutamate-ammonia-ligase adenylyltransferase
LADFDQAVARHTANVRLAFDRLFANVEDSLAAASSARPSIPAELDAAFLDPDEASARLAASIFLKHLANPGNSKPDVAALTRALRTAAAASLNSHRALSLTTRFASSLDKASDPQTVTEQEIDSLVKLCGASEFFGDLLAGSPALIQSLNVDVATVRQRNHLGELSAGVAIQQDFRAELNALRRAWSCLLVEIGARDAAGELQLRELNRLLTDLAVVAIDVALEIAQRELARRYGDLAAAPRLAVLGLGRLGSRGMDYGSDLDLVIVYDSEAPAPVAGLTHDEACARLAELLVTTLSTITRERYLYRVDLRLRPDGQKGPLVSGSESFITYLKKRAGFWEWLAYVKLRAVAGNLGFGRSLESSARQSIHELAHDADHDQLRAETLRLRDRLEKEKTKPRGSINIKHGSGGMLDVYFAVRYLQLRDDVPDDDGDRSTPATLRRLLEAGSLNETTFVALDEGYALLRAVDHQLRLMLGRSGQLPAPDHPAFRDIARRLGYDAAGDLVQELTMRMSGIRKAYESVIRSEVDN